MKIERERATAEISALGAVAVLLLGAALSPQDASAQAICSAPHSSPTLASNGEIRMLPPGEGWIQLSGYGQRATERFDHLGAREPLLQTTQFQTRSVFVTAAIGLIEGVELWAQVPRHHLSLDARAAGTSTSSGLGDFRVALRFGSELFGLELPLAVRVGAKVPGSDFPVDATVLPLTEGQKDAEVSVESGTTLGTLPLYVMGWVGYRWRSEDLDTSYRPGSERFAHVALGGYAGDFTWSVAADALWGGAPLIQGILLTSERRRLIQILPTVGYPVGPGHLEATGQVPLNGRFLPAAMGVSVGYRLGWGGPGF